MDARAHAASVAGRLRAPLRPGREENGAENVGGPSSGEKKTFWLFGEAAEWAEHFPNARIVLVSPPPFLPLPDNVERVYCRRFVEPGRGPHTVFYDL